MLIHPTAVVHPKADIHPSVQIGAYSVIGEYVKIGEDTRIGDHVVIDGWTEIGARNKIFTGAVIGTEPQDLKYDGALTQVTIGDDNLIREYVTINRATFAGERTVIGNQNLLMAYVHVGHNCIIQDRVVIANAVALSGHVLIESRARVSGVLGVHQFVHIGQLAMVGGMSRIERDVPPFMTVEGNPSRVRAINRIGLERAGVDAETIEEIKNAFRILYRQGLTLQEALSKLANSSNPYIRHLHDFLLASSTQPGRRHPIPGK
ncbi:MAG: acyl-ACP--UDP-N-acetylglucosamine O-acyltransferase [Pseudanabaenaceae cyanobacterium]